MLPNISLGEARDSVSDQYGIHSSLAVHESIHKKYIDIYNINIQCLLSERQERTSVDNDEHAIRLGELINHLNVYRPHDIFLHKRHD